MVPVGVDAPDLLPDRQPRGWVEPGRGLVQEEHPRPVDERARQVEPPLHPAGVGLCPPVGRLGQPDQLEQLRRALAAGPARDPVEPALQLEQLPAGLHRVEADLLQGHADAAPHRVTVGNHIMAGDRGAPSGRRQQRAEHPHRGGLARAVRSEEAEDLAGGHVQVNLAHRLDAALEGAAQLARLDRRGCRIARHELT